MRRVKTIFFLVFLVIAGCIQPIDFPVDYVGGSVVISGSISPTAEEENFIEIGLTATTARLPVAVDDAVAYLFDNIGSRIPYTAIGNGKYKLQDNFVGTAGAEYILEVTLSDGRSYRSRKEKIPMKTGSLTSTFKFRQVNSTGIEGSVSQMPLIEVLANVQITDPKLYLRWSMEEWYIRNPTDFPDPFNAVPPPCFIWGQVDPQSLVLFNGAENSATELKNLVLGKRFIDNSFLERHYILVKQHSISFEAFKYWEKVNVLTNKTGSIFDTPPAELLGNIECVTDPDEKAYGYFEARNTAVSRFYVLPSDIPVFIPPFCNYVPGLPEWYYAPECLDCLSLPNSTMDMPWWFGQ